MLGICISSNADLITKALLKLPNGIGTSCISGASLFLVRVEAMTKLKLTGSARLALAVEEQMSLPIGDVAVVVAVVGKV